MRGVRICGGSGERNRKSGTVGAVGCRVSVMRQEWQTSQPQLKTIAEISQPRQGNNVPAPPRCLSPATSKADALPRNRSLSNSFLKQQLSEATASVHPARYPGFREVRWSALLPFSARATFHPDCTVGTGFSPVRPLLRAGVSSGVLASCADAKIRTIFACLRERFAGCDRRFGISPTPEHDVDIDYATAHAGGLICFLWDNFRDKMTFCDCTLGASSSPSQQTLAAATCGTVLEPDSSIFRG